MNIKQFSENAPGRIVSRNDSKGTYLSYVPDKLPRQLIVGRKLSKALLKAENLVKSSQPHEKIEEALLASRLQATQNNISQLKKFIKGYPKELRDARNYLSALKYGLMSDEKASGLMLSLHRRLMWGHGRGSADFRKRQNWIGNAEQTFETATFVPPPVDLLPNCLSELDAYIESKTDTPELIRIALVHYQIQAIHPFMDGNGRIARLMTYILFKRWGLPVVFMSQYFEDHWKNYYQILQQVHETGNYEPWVLFFLHGLNESGR